MVVREGERDGDDGNVVLRERRQMPYTHAARVCDAEVSRQRPRIWQLAAR